MKLENYVLSLKTIVVAILIISLTADGFAQSPQYKNAKGITGNLYPFGHTTRSKRQWLFHPSDFSSAPTGHISAVYMHTSSAVSSTLTNLTITMGATTTSAMISGPWLPADTVFFSASEKVTTAAAGWFKIVLQKPFYYDNTTNFVFSASQEGYTQGFRVLQSTKTGRTMWGSASGSTGTMNNYMLYLGFDMQAAGMDELISKDDFKIFPNPANDQLIINFSKDALPLAVGIYSVRVSNSNMAVAKKLVVN